jgi:hypothetical protein
LHRIGLGGEDAGPEPSISRHNKAKSIGIDHLGLGQERYLHSPGCGLGAPVAELEAIQGAGRAESGEACRVDQQASIFCMRENETAALQRSMTCKNVTSLTGL